MKIFKRAILHTMMVGCVMAGPILPGMHPNWDVALPEDLTNDSGITLEQLSRWDPEGGFAFSGPKIEYFVDGQPWRPPIWTVVAPKGDVEPVYHTRERLEEPPTSPSEVPEPVTFLMVATGLVGWGFGKARGKKVRG